MYYRTHPRAVKHRADTFELDEWGRFTHSIVVFHSVLYPDTNFVTHLRCRGDKADEGEEDEPQDADKGGEMAGADDDTDVVS